MEHSLVGKDISNYHFAFVDKAGDNHFYYGDLTKSGKISTDKLVAQLKIEIGEVHWVLSLPETVVQNITDEEISKLAQSYIESIMEAQKYKTEKMIDDEAMFQEIAKEIKLFKADFTGKRTAFIIMQFSKTPAHDKIVSTIKEILKKYNIVGLRADDKEYSDDIFANIKTYMHCCEFGISVFERILEDNFNPNVSIEVGYMMGLRKHVCLLKDQTLKNLPTDLMGKLYKQFDPQNIETTLPEQIGKWMKDKGIV